MSATEQNIINELIDLKAAALQVVKGATGLLEKLQPSKAVAPHPGLSEETKTGLRLKVNRRAIKKGLQKHK